MRELRKEKILIKCSQVILKCENKTHCISKKNGFERYWGKFFFLVEYLHSRHFVNRYIFSWQHIIIFFSNMYFNSWRAFYIARHCLQAGHVYYTLVQRIFCTRRRWFLGMWQLVLTNISWLSKKYLNGTIFCNLDSKVTHCFLKSLSNNWWNFFIRLFCVVLSNYSFPIKCIWMASHCLCSSYPWTFTRHLFTIRKNFIAANMVSSLSLQVV